MIYNDLVRFSSPISQGELSIQHDFLEFFSFKAKYSILDEIYNDLASFSSPISPGAPSIYQDFLEFFSFTAKYSILDEICNDLVSFSSPISPGSLQFTSIWGRQGSRSSFLHWIMQNLSLKPLRCLCKWNFGQHFHEFQQKLTLFVTSLVFFRRNGDVGTCGDHFFKRWGDWL